MGRSIDFEKKIEELRGYLIKYNGIPSQKENLAAYSNIKYYIKNHSDKPEIRALIEEFHIVDNPEKKKNSQFQKRLEEIRAILEIYKRIPKGEDEKKDYQAVYYFFNHYRDDPEVMKMMYIYVHADCFILVTGRSLYTVKNGAANRPNCDFESAYKYIKFVYETYKELPASRTIVIRVVRRHFRRKYPFKEKDKYDALMYYKYKFSFFREMSELGCPDEKLFQFMSIEK